jgi:hypothetical protein
VVDCQVDACLELDVVHWQSPHCDSFLLGIIICYFLEAVMVDNTSDDVHKPKVRSLILGIKDINVFFGISGQIY